MAIIHVENLRKEYDVKGGVEVAVEGLDMEVGEDEFFTLVGPSGCGKTTTLRCIAGLETPTSGHIYYGDQELTDVPPHRRNIAMMFQNIALYPHMNIRDNISYPLKVRHVDKEERYERAQEAAETMQIPELLDKKPGELSGGQRQRAALARTVVQDPRAFLMDEPLSDLDAKLKVTMRKEIQRIHRKVGRPTVYVTHDQEEAMTMSDRIAVMNDGNFEQVGTPDDLYDRPANKFVAEFIGSPSMNFLPCSIAAVEDGTATVSVLDSTVDVQVGANELSEGDAVDLGFRPEAVTLDTESGLVPGTVSIVERIDDRLLATIDGPEGEITATVPSELDVEEGAEIYVTFEGARTHLFDADSGENVQLDRTEPAVAEA